MLLPFCVLDAGDAAELWALKGIYTSRGGNEPDTECEDDPILGSGGKKALWNVASALCCWLPTAPEPFTPLNNDANSGYGGGGILLP